MQPTSPPTSAIGFWQYLAVLLGMLALRFCLAIGVVSIAHAQEAGCIADHTCLRPGAMEGVWWPQQVQ